MGKEAHETAVEHIYKPSHNIQRMQFGTARIVSLANWTSDNLTAIQMKDKGSGIIRGQNDTCRERKWKAKDNTSSGPAPRVGLLITNYSLAAPAMSGHHLITFSI